MKGNIGKLVIGGALLTTVLFLTSDKANELMYWLHCTLAG
jgi:hypothetical protein